MGANTITKPGTNWGNGTKMNPIYWDAVFAENLYPSLYFYGFGAKRKVPPNYGTTIKIVRYKKTTGTVGSQIANSYGSPLTTSDMKALSAEEVSGTLVKYRGVYGNSDIALLTSLGDPTEFAIRDIARDLALQMDNAIIAKLSGISQGRWEGGNGKAKDNVGSSDTFKLKDIFRIVARLRSQNNPRWPDGAYPCVIHPLVAYDLKAAVSVAGYTWLDVNAYNDGSNAEKVYRGEIGKLGGLRFCESTNIKSQYKATASATGAFELSKATSGYMNFAFAPEAYYVVEADAMQGRVIVKGLGSAGALDPDNSLSTVAAKVYFVPIRGFQAADPDTTGEFRFIRFVCASTVKF